ncbi:BTB/POZ and MATH domain-containing protein 2-like [Lolium rigidum]|uniref:BTB/POZ and MATH domain-containing protein 2-like n=1 Tax=Lolium rigidum TaxID=89674 RepID=UPI001F5C9762|nr:BTB/POZ and MATH domain-containing protein 2-like [Lolium rigidum]
MANNSTSAANHVHNLPKTSSRCITESFTATHDFEVTNYLQLDGMGVGKFVYSGTFSVAGYDWSIRFYPDGVRDDCDGNASAFLYCVSQAKAVRTKFTLNMLEKEGKVKVTDLGAIERIISSPTYDWGYPRFVEKSKLKSLSHANSGNLIIRCVLTVTKEHRTDAVTQPNLADHLLQMWKDTEGADVTFSVCGQLFRAHRCLLAARSPVFKAELFGPMKEKATNCIKIDDIEPQIFEALLHFTYTDSMLDDERFKEDRYGVEKLRVICEGKLCESIDVETVATTLVLAEQHHCKDVKEACLEFMASRKVLRAVMETDGFKHLVTTCPLLMKEILEKVSRSDL